LNKCEMWFCLKTNLKIKKKILGKIYALGLTKPILKKDYRNSFKLRR
jgi:hypothetical protein